MCQSLNISHLYQALCRNYKKKILPKKNSNPAYFTLTTQKAWQPRLIFLKEGNYQPSTEHQNWRSFIQKYYKNSSIQWVTAFLNWHNAHPSPQNELPCDGYPDQIEASYEAPVPNQMVAANTAKQRPEPNLACIRPQIHSKVDALKSNMHNGS